jgi:sugar phosphate isomerase/epimerase
VKIARRCFLQSVATGAIGLPTIGLCAPASSDQLSLGFSLYGMKGVALDVALRECAAIGYSHVELALNPGYPTEPASFSSDARQASRARATELNLELPCLMVLMSLTADEKAHAQALTLIATAGQLARDLVPEHPPILETIVGGSPTKWDEQKAGMSDKLRDWAAAAEAARTTIAIKAHVNSAVNSPERLLWLLDEVKSSAIQVAYDYSHFELQGIDMAESMRLLLPRTKFVHVKDSAGNATKFQFLLPGEGRTDYVRYFRNLLQNGYKGPVCVEVSSQVFNKPDYDPISAAKRCYKTLSTALGKAG